MPTNKIDPRINPKNIVWDEEPKIDPRIDPKNIVWDEDPPETKKATPWYEAPWRQIKAFGAGASNIVESAQKTVGAVYFQATELVQFLDKFTGADLTDWSSAVAAHKADRQLRGLSPMPDSYYKSNEFNQTLTSLRKRSGNLKKQSKAGLNIVASAEKKMQEKAKKTGVAKDAEYAYSLGTSLAQTVPSLAATVLTKNPAPMLSAIGLQSSGDTYTQMRQKEVDIEKSQLMALGAGTVDVVTSKVPVEMLLKPAKSFVTTVLRNTFGEVVQESVAEGLKTALEKGIVSPNITLGEAIVRMKDAGVSAAILSPLMTVATYPLIPKARAPRNTASEAAISTLKAHGIEAEDILNPELKPWSKAQVEDIIDNQKTSEEVLSEQSQINAKPPINEEAVFTLKEGLDNQEKALDAIAAREKALGIEEDSEALIPPPPPTKNSEVGPIKDEQSKISKFRTNTIKETTELTDWVKDNVLIPEEFKYDPQQTKEWTDRAIKKIQEEEGDSIKNILDEKAPFTPEDVYVGAIAIKKLESFIVDSPERMKTYLELTKAYASKIRQSARTLKAVDTAWTKSKDSSAAIIKLQSFIKGFKEEIENKTTLSKKHKTSLINKLDKVLNPNITKKILDIYESIRDLPATNIKRKKAILHIKRLVYDRVKPIIHSPFNRTIEGLNEYVSGNLMGSVSSLGFVNTTTNLLRFANENIKLGLTGLFFNNDPKIQRDVRNQFIGEIEGIRQIFLKDNPIIGEVKNTVNTIKESPLSLLDKIHNGVIELEDFIEASNLAAASDIEGRSDFSQSGRNIRIGDLDDPTNLVKLAYNVGGLLTRSPFHVNQLADNIAVQINAFGKARVGVREVVDASGLIGKEAVQYESILWDDFIKYAQGDPNIMASKQLEVVQRIYDEAMEYALEQTGQGKLPQWLEEINNLRNEHPGSKFFIFRFFRQPINWTKYSLWNNMPWSKLLVEKQQALMLGKEGTLQEQRRARFDLGYTTFCLMGLVCLAASGVNVISGRHPQQKRSEQFGADLPEESIDLGGSALSKFTNQTEGTWLSYSRYDQIARPLSIIATIVEHWDLFNKTEEDAENTSGALLALGLSMTEANKKREKEQIKNDKNKKKLGIAGSLALNSVNAALGSVALQDLANLYKMADPTYSSNTLLSGKNYYLKSQIKGFLPASGFLKSIQRGSIGIGKDPVIREIETWVDQVIGTYNSSALKPKLNPVSGEEIKNEGEYFGMRLTKSALQKHPSLLKMYQLNIPFTPPGEEFMGHKFTQEEHWEYQRFIDTKFHLINRLDELVKSEGFDDQLEDIQKKQIQQFIIHIRAYAGQAYLVSKDLFNTVIKNKVSKKLEGLMESTSNLPDLTDPNTDLNLLTFPNE